MSDIGQGRKALASRVLEGDGKASPSERRAAFNNSGLANQQLRLSTRLRTMPLGSQTRTSPPCGSRDSAKTKSSRLWCAPRSGRPVGNTTGHLRPLRPQARVSEHETSNPRQRPRFRYEGTFCAHSDNVAPTSARRDQTHQVPGRLLRRADVGSNPGGHARTLRLVGR